MNLIIYHASCWDGFCSAWLCHLVWPDAEFVPANYGWEPPDVTDKDVLIVDFSYSKEILLELKAKARSLQVLDHHETAEKELAGLPFCTFDKTRSGAGLTWDYLVGLPWANLPGASFRQIFYDKYKFSQLINNRHWLVAYIQDRDLWRKELKNTDAINAAVRSYPLDFTTWNIMAGKSVEGLVEEGLAVLRQQKQVIDHHLKYLQRIELKYSPHADPIVGKGVSCSTGHIWSEIMHEMLVQEPDLQFAMVWQDTADGIRLYSIRTPRNGDLNAGEIAKAFGGGGHPNAAGFKMDVKIVLPDNAPVHSRIS